MRKGALFACIGMALLQAGCSSLDAIYLRDGIGTELGASDLSAVSNLQDLYVGEVCRQAGLRVVQRGEGLYCDEVLMRPNEWATFVQAGMNDVDRRCDAYLGWLDNKRRWREPILKQLHTTAATTAAILGLTGVGATPIAVVGAAFGFAQDTFVNFHSRLITEVDNAVIQSVVLDNQNQFRAKIVNSAINNRPAAIYLLRNYLRICMAFSIEMSISNTIMTYHRGGAEALMRNDPILTQAPRIARVTATGPVSTGERLGGNVVRGTTTDRAFSRIIANYDPDLYTIGYVRNVLSKLCVRSSERSVTSRVNSLIRVYQYFAYEGTANFQSRVTGKLTSDEMKELGGLVGGCPIDRANFYEWQDQRFAGGIASSPLVTLINRKLPDAQKLPTDKTVSRDQIRDKISVVRSTMGDSLFLKEPAVAKQFTPDLVDALGQ